MAAHNFVGGLIGIELQEGMFVRFLLGLVIGHVASEIVLDGMDGEFIRGDGIG
jgi:hypothetical protein